MASRAVKEDWQEIKKRQTAALKKLPPNNFFCRRYKHAFNPVGIISENGHVIEVSQCLRCTMTREEPLNVDGTRWARPGGKPLQARYKPPPGYQIEGLGRIELAAVRAESIRRAKLDKRVFKSKTELYDTIQQGES